MVITGADTNDLAQYDRLAQLARRAGFKYMGCGALSGITEDQVYDPDDTWLRFVIINSGVMKFVETDLVNGVISKPYIEKNAALLAEKSKILARHGLKGVMGLLEPQILPEWFYAKRPEIRGARCDNPCLSLDDYYAPCLDRGEVLAHYREAVRKVLEIAPEVGVISMYTNDSGAGICWCTGLYPGPNGPDHCKDVPMGRRIEEWLRAMLAGADDAGRELRIVFVPLHFGREEIYSTIDRLPKNAYLSFGEGGYRDMPNLPFITGETRDYIARSKARRRGAVLRIDATLSYPLGPVAEPPIPYFTLDALREASKVGAEVLALGGVGAPVDGVDTVPTMAIMAGLARPPKSWWEIDKTVAKIAAAHVGRRLAPALVSAWRDVHAAFTTWPAIADTNHMLYPFYSIMGDRWLVRPLVPAPEKLSRDERAYYAKYLHGDQDGKDAESFFIGEGMKNYKIDEMKWLVTMYDEMMMWMNRALDTLDEAKARLDAEDEDVRKRFMLQYARVAIMRAIWRTQRNVLRTQTTIEFFTGEKKDEYWHVIRRDESFLLPATYRRLFLEAVDDEIANCRDIIRLIRESDVPLIHTDEVEEQYILPRNLPELIEKKMALMEAHKGDIDILFPNCPPETFTDPTYEWADKRHRGEKNV